MIKAVDFIYEVDCLFSCMMGINETKRGGVYDRYTTMCVGR